MFDPSQSGMYEPYRPQPEWKLWLYIAVIIGLPTALAIWLMVEFL
jgi:hypothetical protein